jgi:hypothetical protein
VITSTSAPAPPNVSLISERYVTLRKLEILIQSKKLRRTKSPSKTALMMTEGPSKLYEFVGFGFWGSISVMVKTNIKNKE